MTPGPVAEEIFSASRAAGFFQSEAKDNCDSKSQTQHNQQVRDGGSISRMREL
jgi:hypothetical protein